jgi:2-isopropylmalate synthase
MKQVRGASGVEFSAHCHNDLGMAVANSLAAIRAGVSYVEVTVNGVGERAGNCSLEELVMAIETRKDILGVQTGIRTEQIYETSRQFSRAMQFPIAFNKPIVGRNAFQHEAGIHQDGLLKNRSTYEIMNPDNMGIPRSMIVLGKHSGRHAIRHRVEELGVKLNDEQMESLYTEFKETADRKKVVHDAELMQMVGTTVDQVLEPYALEQMQVVTGTNGHRVASCTIRDLAAGTVQSFSATGSGPIDALVHSIKNGLPFEADFADMELYSLSTGEQANGEAVVTVVVDGSSYRGTAINQDIIVAVGQAFMAACNQAARVIVNGGSAAGEKAEKAVEAEITIP